MYSYSRKYLFIKDVHDSLFVGEQKCGHIHVRFNIMEVSTRMFTDFVQTRANQWITILANVKFANGT